MALQRYKAKAQAGDWRTLQHNDYHSHPAELARRPRTSAGSLVLQWGLPTVGEAATTSVVVAVVTTSARRHTMCQHIHRNAPRWIHTTQ
jgi:hypothetical protein